MASLRDNAGFVTAQAIDPSGALALAPARVRSSAFRMTAVRFDIQNQNDTPENRLVISRIPGPRRGSALSCRASTARPIALPTRRDRDHRACAAGDPRPAAFDPPNHREAP